MSYSLMAVFLVLSLASPLQAHADTQARAMAASGNIYHSDLHPLLGYCSWAAENVGVGPTWEAVDAALAASPGHAANRAYPWTEMARSVYEQDGLVWVVEEFCVVAAEAPPPTTTTTTTTTVPTTEEIETMNGWTVAWILWGAMFAAIEIPALIRKGGDDTLSDHIRKWFATMDKPAGWRWRRYTLAAFLCWLSLHLMGVGGF